MRWHHHLSLLVLVLACSSHETEYKVPAFAQFPCPKGTHPNLHNMGGEIFRRCLDAYGNADGPFVSWDLRTGAISTKGTYRHGEQDGTMTTYHPNGEKLGEGTFVRGMHDGEWRIWDEDGNLKVIQVYDAKLGGKLVNQKVFPTPNKNK